MKRFALLALLTAAPLAAQTVDAPAGPVRGTTDGDVRVFKGLPYAAPPVGAMRWRAPAKLPRWTAPRDATAFGPGCVQPQGRSASVYSNDPMPVSEDCLTLNVWTPKNARKAPVMVWIHGGSLRTGSSREPVYDGRKFAERGVIVVSINYRLGVLGWLAHPGLSAENTPRVSGNYGLLDQIAALHWVRNNIAAFGGDPAQVTIAGESAGALSVMYLLASPAARGLYARAIAQSAYMVSTPELRRVAFGAPSGEAMGEMVAGGLQAPNVATLRAMGAQEITDRASQLGFAPFGTVDGLLLREQLVDTFDAGRQAPVPLIAGFNQGEIRSMRMLAPKLPASAALYEQEIRKRYGDLAEAFLRLYPAGDYAESILATTRDALYGWTSERLVRKQTAIGQPAYLYLFDHGYPAMESAGLHAFHASELPYVFGTAALTPPNWPKVPDTAVEGDLSTALLDAWAGFMRDGKPSAAWPAFGSTGSYLHIAERPEVRRGLLPGMYAINEEVMCRRRATGKVAWNWNVGLLAPTLPAKTDRCG